MRVANWPQRLAEEISAWREVEFEWGRTDCCQFVGAVCLSITGHDRREMFAGYDSETGAGRVLVEHGGIEALLTRAFGQPKPASFARRGDVVLCEFGNGLQPAIVEGASCCAPSIHGGLARRKIIADRTYPDAALAWSVG